MNLPAALAAASGALLLQGDALETLRLLPDCSVDSVITDPPAGISFMNRSWDSDRGGRDHWIAWLSGIMAEALRVLRPGAHALVWALPRTSHWTATALEDAGFEIRDLLTHVYATGWPKNLDLSKAIDRELGAEREVIGMARRPIAGTEYHAGERIYARKDEYEITAPATEEARRWAGWGTALAPAAENWILCRKPIAGKNIAANILEHGVGGLNIDGSRGGGGRWPKNALFSHSPWCDESGCVPGCAVALLDEQAGVRKSGSRKAGVRKGLGYGSRSRGDGGPAIEGSVGGASRFFPTFRYIPKPTRTEKEAGLAALPERVLHRVNAGGLEHEPRFAPIAVKNHHNTVKPAALMAWLCRLVTPPGGIVLDPFFGSGTTGVAAVMEGFSVVGIEQEAEFVEIAAARIAHALAHGPS